MLFSLRNIIDQLLFGFLFIYFLRRPHNWCVLLVNFGKCSLCYHLRLAVSSIGSLIIGVNNNPKKYYGNPFSLMLMRSKEWLWNHVTINVITGLAVYIFPYDIKRSWIVKWVLVPRSIIESLGYVKELIYWV